VEKSLFVFVACSVLFATGCKKKSTEPITDNRTTEGQFFLLTISMMAGPERWWKRSCGTAVKQRRRTTPFTNYRPRTEPH
jgi:hypothetical protein